MKLANIHGYSLIKLAEKQIFSLIKLAGNLEVRKKSVTLQRKLVLKSVNRYEAKTI